MTLRILPYLVQGTQEWHDQRRGMVTASVVGQLVTPTLKVDAPRLWESDRPTNGPCAGAFGSSRTPWTAYQRTEGARPWTPR